MMKIAMSRTASKLLAALLDRAGDDRNRILLTELRSVDWQSLTFVGERHCIELRIAGEDCAGIAERLTSGIAEVDFKIPGQIVADIAVAGEPRRQPDGGLAVAIEALTIAE